MSANENTSHPSALIVGAIGVVFGDIGTGAVGRFFGPVMCAWFGILAVLGVLSIWEALAVLAALNPVYALEFLVGHPGASFLALAAVVLAACGEKGLAFDLDKTSFFLSREVVVPKLAPPMALWRGLFFVWMLRNAQSATEFFRIPANRVVELGTLIEI